MRILALHGNRCAADASATDPTSRACRSLAFRIPPRCPLPRSTHRAPSFSSPRSQNGEVFATRLAPHLRKLRERVPEAEIVFLDAPLELPRRPGDELAMRTWWRRDGGGGGGRAFEGWETSLATLRDAWRERGPFRGVIGFSQGAAVGFLLSLLAESADRDADAAGAVDPTGADHPDAPFASLEFAILCAGYVPAPSPVRAQGVRPVDGARVGIAGGRSRSVLVIAGDADDAVPADAAVAVAGWFEDAVVRKHPGSHVFPAKPADVAAVVDFIAARSRKTRKKRAKEKATDAMDGSIAAADSSVDPSVAADSVSASDSDSDVAPEMTEELAEELEALDAIFGDEMTVVEPGRAFAFALPELAAKLGTQIAPDPKLSLELPRGYPDVPVRVRARRGLTGVSPNLARALTTGVANAVEMAARPLLGSPAVYSVVTEAREWLDAAADGARTKDEGDEERRPGNDAGSGSRARDDDDSDALDDVTDVTETSAARWWEREETDAAAVTAATAAASATEHSLRARGAPAPCVAAGGRWNFTVGLVGKPSAGKSSFFNAATEAAEGAARAARVAPHPFTTIEPNLGAAFAPATCPCALVGLDRACDPSHGAEDVDGTHCRRIPILVKDVAGLVPGAHAGRGRGNAFLNDLCDADVLVHVVDASGRSDREGVDHSGGDADAANGANGGAFDPGDDVQWVREELHHWIFGNARRKWSSVRRKPERFRELFTGYHCARTAADEAMSRAGVLDPKALTRETVHGWTEADLHLIVAHFLRVRFPVLLALNKTDLPGARARAAAVRERWPEEPATTLSAIRREGVRRVLRDAVALGRVTLGFPVADLDTGASTRARRDAKVIGSNPDGGAMRECVTLRPGSTVWDLFQATKIGGGAQGEADDGGGTAVRPKGEFVRAECRDGPGGARRRALRRDERVTDENCVVRFYTNAKVQWQGKRR